MSEADSVAKLKFGLEALAKRKLSASSADASNFEPLSGHAGVSYSFSLKTPGADARKLVVRTIPEGVPPKGPADVVRQARIMQAMATAHVPVPPIIWAEDSTPELSSPFFVADFVAGYQIPPDWRQLTDHDRALGRRAMAALAQLHSVDWRTCADAFGEPQTLEMEFSRLSKLVDRPTIDIAEGGRINALRARLLETQPRGLNIGCVHGDFHWGNLIFGDDEVRAFVDWEISFIGPTLLDVGWIAFYADAKSFTGVTADKALRVGLAPEEIVDCYRAAAGRAAPSEQFAWFRAFAAYRYGAITLFNCMLHRRGKHHDPMWEEVIEAVPQMMERGLEVLSGGAPR